MISSININELNEKENIIDIRNIENYNYSHIPGAINIPSEKLLINPNKYINKKEKYYIYCQHGKTSYNICRILSNMGYNVIELKGGYDSYIKNKRNL